MPDPINPSRCFWRFSAPFSAFFLAMVAVSPVNAGSQWYESPFQWNVGWEIGVSADGSAVVGTTHLWSPSENRAVELPADFVAQGGITADGKILTGTVYGATWEPSIWSESQGVRRVSGIDNASAFGISDDGSTIVGSYSGDPTTAYRWTESTSDSQIPLPAGFTGAHGDMVSGDGNVVAGFGWGQFPGWHAYRWSEETGAHDLGTFGDKEWYRAADLSRDGSVVVGYGYEKSDVTRENFAYEAYRWTEEQGIVGLGTLPGRVQSLAKVVSEDGQLVLGTTFAEASNSESSLSVLAEELFIWTAAAGMQSLTDMLSDELGMELPSNLMVRAMSADERTIVGSARDLTDQFDQQLWAVVLDRPLRELLQTGVVGDFNGDGVVNIADIDLMGDAIREGTQDQRFDLDESETVNVDDLAVLIHNELRTWFGDANLDGEFNSGDLVDIFTVGKYETAEEAGWTEGDWNADGFFGSGDVVFAFQDGGYEQGPKGAASAVPEPTTMLALIMGVLILHRPMRHLER